jgi:conjugal transfer pilus assembly protein TraD
MPSAERNAAATLHASLLWLAVTIVYGVLAVGTQGWALLALACVAGAFALVKGYRHWIARRGEAHLQALSFVSQSTLVDLAIRTPQHLYLGQGFTIAHPHVSAWFRGRNACGNNMRQQEGNSTATANGWIAQVASKAEVRPVLHSLKDQTGHMIVTGITGSGKTVFAVLYAVQRVLRGHATCVVDPKGTPELEAALRAVARRVQRPFILLDPTRPEQSARLNLLGEFNRYTEIPSRLLTTSAERNDFAQIGWCFVARLVAGLEMAKRPITLREIRTRMLATPEASVADLLDVCIDAWTAAQPVPITPRDVHTGEAVLTPKAQARGESKRRVELIQRYRIDLPAHPVIDGLLATHGHDPAHFLKVTLALQPTLEKLTATSLAPIFSPSSANAPNASGPEATRMWTLPEAIAARAVVYLRTDSLSDAEVGSALATLFVANVVAVAGERYRAPTGESNVPPVALVIDEAVEAMSLPLIQLMNKGRQAQFDCLLLTQDISDFTVKLGSEPLRDMVLGNANSLLSFRVTSAATQEWVAQRLGTVDLAEPHLSQSVTYRHEGGGLQLGGTIAQGLREREVERFPKSLLAQLPDRHFVMINPQGVACFGSVPIMQPEPAPASTSFASLYGQLPYSQPPA